MASMTTFLSTPSARRATRPFPLRIYDYKISIHALCEEGDMEGSTSDVTHLRFLSTPSARRATRLRSSSALYLANFYPRPLRGGRRCWPRPGTRTHPISIHALCEEGDLVFLHVHANGENFYPRPLRGGRPQAPANFFRTSLFLSTPSARRATQISSAAPKAVSQFLSTPSARRATRWGACCRC